MEFSKETIQELIQQRVATLFSTGENNCAMTVLRVYSEIFETPVDAQVIDAAWCMPGAGGVKHLCGLVGGAVMFVGVWGAQQELHRKALSPITRALNGAIQEQFGSLDCRDLRREKGCSALASEFLNFTVPILASEFESVIRSGA